MRPGIDVLKVGRIETSIDSQRRRQHKIFPVVHVDRNSVSVSAEHDSPGTDLLIETHAVLGIGEHIEFHLPDASYRTAAIMWTDGQLAGCNFIQPTIVNSADNEVSPPNRQIVQDRSDGERNLAASGTWPLGLRIWVIVGLALLLWILISAATYLVWS